MHHFAISGVETWLWLPPLVSAVISTLTSVGGLSGAFLILPFQMSVLGFAGPAVSSTNLLFNIIAIPGGVYRYFREKRMVWPLTWAIILGTLPGVILGAFVRIHLMPDPAVFKLFVALVLAYIGVRLVRSILQPGSPPNTGSQGTFDVRDARFTFGSISYTFRGTHYEASTKGIMVLSLVVGIIGGTYGIGGGAIIAPFLVSVLGLPVHTIAGASLMSTFVTSIVGVLFYTLIQPVYAGSGVVTQPDWLLGLLFGLGGLAGTYVGASIQRFLPERLIKGVLALSIAVVVVKYALEGIGHFYQ